jgi:membrane fusion protein, multidrug efflux system
MVVNRLPIAFLFCAVTTFVEGSPEALSQRFDFEQQDMNVMRGQLLPINRTVLAAGMTGQLVDFPVVKGQFISTGDQVAKFDCRVEIVNFKIARAKEDAASSQLLVNERLQALKNVSNLELQLSQSQLAIAGAERERAEVVLSMCDLSAPFDGVVTMKYVEAHQSVSQGEPLIELTDIHNLEVEMVVSSTMMDAYKPGSLFSIKIDETNKTFEAKIDRIVGRVDPVSQTVLVIGNLIGETTGLLPGMSGRVSFSTK